MTVSIRIKSVFIEIRNGVKSRFILAIFMLITKYVYFNFLKINLFTIFLFLLSPKFAPFHF